MFYNKLWKISPNYLQFNVTLKNKELFKVWTQKKDKQRNIKSECIQNTVTGIIDMLFLIKNLNITCTFILWKLHQY
jgi:5-methylcytosine-specific restriction endonuclease McrBC GTP-binding regulatory subunit McrB